MSKQRPLVIIDPYNWWPNSNDLIYELSKIGVDVTFISNTNNCDLNFVKKFNQKNAIFKALECLFKIPYYVFIYRKKRVILMWLPLPIFNHFFLLILKIFGSDHYIWLHNSIPHSLYKYNSFLTKIVPKIWPLFGNLITMNYDFYLVSKGFGISNVLFIDIGVASTRNINENIQRKYTFGLIGRFENYKYPKNFIKSLEKFCQKNNFSVLACGKNATKFVPENSVFEIHSGFVPPNQYDDLIQQVEVILCPYEYIDMSGVISTCIEKDIFWYANSVGQIKFMKGFEFCHEEICSHETFIKNSYASYEKNYEKYQLASKLYVKKNHWGECAKKIEQIIC